MSQTSYQLLYSAVTGESYMRSMKRILLYQLSYKTEVLTRLELATHICLNAK